MGRGGEEEGEVGGRRDDSAVEETEVAGVDVDRGGNVIGEKQQRTVK